MKRSAFTLVELLVVLVIIIMLVGLSVAAFRPDNSDRLNAAARLVQSKIMLSHSLATSDRDACGIRFDRDPDDPSIVRSAAMLSANGYAEATVYDIRTITGDPVTAGDDYWLVIGDFTRLVDRNLLVVGKHIELPANSGDWYVLSDSEFNPAGGRLSFAGVYKYRTWGTDPSSTQAASYMPSHPWDAATGLLTPIECRFELVPTTHANDTPIVFPAGTCIDLDASQVPQAWRTPTAHCDLLFNAIGESEAGEIVHLYVTRLADVELTRNLFPDHPVNGGSRSLPIVPANEPNVPAEPPYVVTVLPHSGLVMVSDVNFDDSDSDDQADDPFQYGRMGMEVNR